MNAVNDIILLGEKLREARDLALRSDSLEQACRETEARVLSLRATESELNEAVRKAEALAERVLQEARDDASAVAKVAAAERKAKAAECDSACKAREDEAERKVEELNARCEQATSRLDDLENEESRLGQTVAALRAEIATLKERARTFLG